MQATPAVTPAELRSPIASRRHGLHRSGCWLAGCGACELGLSCHERACVDQLLYLVAALAWCFSIGFPISFMEIAAIPVGVLCAVSFSFFHACVEKLPLGDHIPTFVLLWWRGPPGRAPHSCGLWIAISVFHGRDADFRLDDLDFLPLLHERRKLIAAIALGMLALNVAQLANHLGVKHGISWLVIRPFTDRNGGWWPEVIAGSMLVAALGLHLPVAMMGAHQPSGSRSLPQ